MSTPWYQRLLFYLYWVLQPILLIGSLLDTVTNAVEWLTPLTMQLGTVGVVLGTVLLEVSLRLRPLPWRQKNTIRIASLWPWMFVVATGIILALWSPVIVRPSSYCDDAACLPDTVAFVSARDGASDIFLMNGYDGSELVNLTHDSHDDWEPTWKPDGTQIAFVSYREDSNPEIYVMDVDGNDIRRLTHTTEFAQDDANELFPAWSPDGAQIAFTYGPVGHRDVYIMDADGSNRAQLTHDHADNIAPAWSPDGTTLAVHAFRSSSYDIVLLDAETGRVIRQLTTDASEDSFPAWSPDGKRIAFVSDRTGRHQLFWVSAGGGVPVQITNDINSNAVPSWSSDGNRIVFHSREVPDPETSEQALPPEIYSIASDGSGLTRLTNNKASDADPEWSPACDISRSTHPFLRCKWLFLWPTAAILLMFSLGGGMSRFVRWITKRRERATSSR
jgi:Tol biopolymer transport system component